MEAVNPECWEIVSDKGALTRLAQGVTGPASVQRATGPMCRKFF